MRIDPDFTEDTVAVALATHLATLTYPNLIFDITPFSRSKERWLGADARLTSRVRGFLPFYMQFKRPHAYSDSSRSKIVRDRKSLTPPLTTSPRTLLFNLREKQPTHTDYQHNVLFRLNGHLTTLSLGQAAYVCPLFLDRGAYLFHTHLAALAHDWVRFGPLRLRSALNGGTYSFAHVPLLAEHITIPPHELVATAKHSYSFLEDGTEVCFHSPLSLPDSSMRLSDWLEKLFRQFLESNQLIRPESSTIRLRQLLDLDESPAFQAFDIDAFGHDPEIKSWLEWGNYLQRTFEIQQFAILAYEN